MIDLRFRGSLDDFRALFGAHFDAASLDELEAADEISIESPPLALVEPVPDPPESAPPESAPPEPAVLTGQEVVAAAEAIAAQQKAAHAARQRAAAWTFFVSFCFEWARGFADEEAEQPNRADMMTELGQGRWPIPVLTMAYDLGSLQRLIEKALLTDLERAKESFAHYQAVKGYPEAELASDSWLDYVDQLACTMVQVSHAGFPDLAGAYDYSAGWRRVEEM